MKTVRIRWALALALVVSAQLSSAADLEPGTITARQFAKLAIHGAITAQASSVPRDRLKIQYECFLAMEESRLVPLYVLLLKGEFSTDELRVIDRFQETEAAGKLAANAMFMFQQQNPGRFAPELEKAQPEFTEQDYAEIKRFAATAAGEKYRKSEIVHSGDIKGPIPDKLKAAVLECIMLRPAATPQTPSK